MTVEADLRSLILANSGITTLVGQRVTWGARPQGVEQPDIVLLLVAGAPGYTMAGEDGLDQSLVQMDIRASTSLLDATAVRDAVRSALSGFSGTVGSTTFYSIFLRQVRQRAEQAEGGGMAYLIQMDWDVASHTAG